MNPYKIDILAFGAHPDDVECAAAGVLIKHIGMGKTVAIIDLTTGEMGSYGTPQSRKSEAATASKILGIQHREQLNLLDGSIENNEESRLKVIQMIRKYQPDIVLCNAIHDRHPDHANAAKLVADACFLSGLKMKTTFDDNEEQKAWRPKAVYHYIQDYYIEPDFVIDISSEMDTKLKAIRAFESQFVTANSNDANGISGLIDQIKSTNSIFGRPINAKFAEGFTVNRYIGVTDFYNLI
ncbi:bacillithiol biosynthesis deacetylase BshB1 [Flavobacterium laiguense]|uniref:Bacillithiol biosynthesis deacetylase BshB1 n=1 Tax=Flavobacterium laiguense TaxID=2169409 RepID=A0A2U1JP32_9FLAO|nr:bacillithiol biosynthesis deacetylase BshB1 [Flavobacterium laiguense]PWA06719.1 bacillithiol biosynthesis deacetylase BshB1 [Flavobacterium laiguense]